MSRIEWPAWLRRYLRTLGLMWLLTNGVLAVVLVSQGVFPYASGPLALAGLVMVVGWLCSKDATSQSSQTLQATWPVSMPAIPPVEDRAEVVTGWRGYGVTAEGMLFGAAGTIWEGAVMEAMCGSQDHVGKALNDDVVYRLWVQRGRGGLGERCVEHLTNGVCGCGIHGRASADEALGWCGPVAARVRAYGIVAVDDDGNFRASQCEIEELFVPSSNGLIPLLRERYGVPVRVMGSRIESVIR